MADEKLTNLGHLKILGKRVDDELEEVDRKNADIPVRRDITLAAASWALSEDGASYVYTYPFAGVTPNHRADVIYDDASVRLAARFGVSSSTDTIQNAVVFTSKKLPAGDLTGQVYIMESVPYASEHSEEQEEV